MQETRGNRLPGHGAQLVIAVFDDWDALQTVLEEIAVQEPGRSGTLLHRSGSTISDGRVSGLSA
jgi:hypothetical protein